MSYNTRYLPQVSSLLQVPEVILTYVLVKFGAVRNNSKAQRFTTKTFISGFCHESDADLYHHWHFQCFLILFEEVALIWDMTSDANGKSTRVGRNVISFYFIFLKINLILRE